MQVTHATPEHAMNCITMHSYTGEKITRYSCCTLVTIQMVIAVILKYYHTFADIAEFVNTAYEHLQAYLNRETFQKSTKAFYDSISEVDELFVKMLGLAQNLHHDPTDDNMPQTAGKKI